jgi:hypothetical protein
MYVRQDNLVWGVRESRWEVPNFKALPDIWKTSTKMSTPLVEWTQLASSVQKYMYECLSVWGS